MLMAETGCFWGANSWEDMHTDAITEGVQPQPQYLRSQGNLLHITDAALCCTRIKIPLHFSTLLPREKNHILKICIFASLYAATAYSYLLTFMNTAIQHQCTGVAVSGSFVIRPVSWCAAGIWTRLAVVQAHVQVMGRKRLHLLWQLK